MAECPRSLSNETKARIRSSLRQLWGERLKWKRSREKLLLSWAKSIAISAKKGGVDQEELHWDSHEKLKREIACEQLQWAADKAKAKEMARVRADRAAQAKAEKMARLAEKRREQEQKAQVGGQIKRAHKKSKEEKEELAVAQELKLKARLAKIHSKKSLSGQVTSQDHRAWEKFDMNITKRDEQLQKEVSLADQIRAAKNKKAEFEAIEPLITSSSFY